MRYVQLRAFHYVAIHGGFSRAAKALHVTQPAISDQVRRLEAEYDIKLFERRNKQIVVTTDGLALLDITHRMFEIEQRALELLSESRATRTGTLRIVADSAHHMTQVLARFRQEFPGVFISVRSGNSGQVIEQLDRYEADIGVLGNLPTDNKHDVITLDSTPIIAFAPVGTAQGMRKSVSLKELCTWPLVMREQGSRTRAKLEEAVNAAGYLLSISIEAEGREAVRQIVAAGGGVGIVSEAEFTSSPELQKIRIRNVNLTMEEAIVCLRERRENKLISRFMQLAREMAQGDG
ncbi:MAG: LysR family transcriptional regulator [Granulosicoccus sp.]|nr:LysR family transcriptional regulator [Granulosicoccus sp.]